MEKDEAAEEKDLARQQRLVGSTAHLALQNVENFTNLYLAAEQLHHWGS